ncbi:ANTAR domain-containing protein [Scleromatobacter humisilvae]|uniref:ANTAR domain-containing protein n=1 Tax=Scleromatobacter humisilvae TaxID=2897159 RepID=A0A9X1YG17_9BURK|nr:ANTAR domain-containing protein [Scleromatobacter humisilvae]MCK9685017.1 ANTAR domain-containing protein [Scleromatobacter humisilvae]
MSPTLSLDLTGPADRAWRAAFDTLAVPLGEACGGHNLVQRTNSALPELLVCLAPTLTAELAAALSPWGGAPPCAVLLLTPPVAIDAAMAARAAELGIHHWQWFGQEEDAAAALASGRSIAQARHGRETALRRALARAHGQLDERRCVDRAKGVLMSARGLDESEAFGLLRSAAMNVNLRLGEVSRSVVEAAQWADAMNRAGQLRMLSQRLVRVVAQRLLRLDARSAAEIAAQSTQRVHDNLAMLARQCAGTSAQAALAEATRCWEALAAALAPARVALDELAHIDALAARLLEAAEQLTQALQEASGRRALHIVNICGRQRMRAQRIAKLSLVCALSSPRAPSDAAAALLDEFEAAQRELEQAPLRSPEIRQALAAIGDEWLRLLAGLRTAQTADGRRALVHASETMLERLDALTNAYEHSLQVILG